MDGYFVTPQDVEQIEMRQGVYRRTMATTDEAMLCEFYLLKGSEIPVHSHMNDQVGYVVYGKIEVTIGKKTRICHAGESYAIPGGIEHKVMVLADTLAIDVFSPPREDYRTESR